MTVLRVPSKLPTLARGLWYRGVQAALFVRAASPALHIRRRRPRTSPVMPVIAPAAAPAAAATVRPHTIRASGDMTDWGAVQTFASRAAHRLGRGHGPVLIDLTGVERADTKLIACLVCLVSSARSARRPMEFKVSPAVEAWVSLCGLNQVLGVPAPTGSKPA